MLCLRMRRRHTRLVCTYVKSILWNTKDFFSEPTISSFFRHQQCIAAVCERAIKLYTPKLFYFSPSRKSQNQFSEIVYSNMYMCCITCVWQLQTPSYTSCYIYLIPNQQLLHYLHYVIIAIVYQIEYVTYT